MAVIGNSATQQAFTPAVDYFSGNGSTTAFTLSRPVASVAQVEAVIDNVVQNPSSAYTVSSNTITFTSAPLSGTNNIYVRYTSPITQVIAPGQGTVNTTALGNITNIASGNSSLTLQTGSGNTTAVTVDTSQNVGIGTASPANKLDVAGIITASGSPSNPTGTTVSFYNGSGVGPTISGYQFAVRTGGTPAEAMRIDNSGNVGIGTSSPASVASGHTVLDVASAAGKSTNLYLHGNGTSGGSGGLQIQSSTGDAGIYQNSNQPLNFGTNATERMRIDQNGLVRIGSSSGGNGVRLNVTGNTAPDTLCSFYDTRNDGASGVPMFYFQRINGTVGSVTTTTTSTSYNTSSDYRLKENIQPMQNALGVVSQLKPVTYKWKVDGLDGQGFIAHELQEVVPDCVSGEKDAVDEEGNPKYQGIDTSFLVATLTAAIQELAAKNDALTARIEALENR